MRVLTVVIPAYNSEAYLERAVESLLPFKEQLEIIIVDDGSVDMTAQIADRYASLYADAVIVVHKENGGHGSAINCGLSRATCPYFKVLDSDDYFDRAALASLLALLDKASLAAYEKVDLIFTDYTIELLLQQFQDKTATFSNEELYPKERDKKFLYLPNTLKAVLPQNCIFTWDKARCWSFRHLLIMHSLCYSTEFLRSINLHLPEGVYYEDNYFSLIPLQYVRKMYYLPVCLYVYYIGRPDQSVSLQKIVKNYRHQAKVTCALLNDLHYEMKWDSLPEPLRDLTIKHMARLYEMCQIIQLLEPGHEHYASLRAVQLDFIAKEPHLWQAVNKKLLVMFLNFANRRLQLLSKFIIKIIRKFGLLNF